MRKLLMELLKSSSERVRVARTQASMDVMFGWLAALLQLHDNGRYSRSLPTSGRRLPMTRKSEG